MINLTQLDKLPSIPKKYNDSFFGMVTLIYGWMNLLYTFFGYLLGKETSLKIILDLTASAILLTSYPLYMRFKAWRELLSTVCLLVIGWLTFNQLFYPSFSGFGIYSLFFLPSMIFFLMNTKKGIVLNLCSFIILVAITLLQTLGYVETKYPSTMLVQAMFFSTIIAAFHLSSVMIILKLLREIDNQRGKLSALLDNLPAGVIMADASTKLVSMTNMAAKNLFRDRLTKNAEVYDLCARLDIRKSSGEPLPDDELPLVPALLDKRQSSVSGVFSSGPEGKKVHLRLAAAPIAAADGKVVGAVMIVEDMTREHEVEAMRSELISLASHQLKNPLTNIKWSIEALRDESLGKLNKDQRETTLDMEKTTNRIIGLVNDLLSVSRIETDRDFVIALENADIVPILRGVEHDLMALAESKSVTVRFVDLPGRLNFIMDPLKIREALSNLVSNAIKYSKDGGEVEIGIIKTKHDDAVLFVRDHGIGIPEEDQEKIFSRFFRAGNANEAAEGTGLGLYITKVIIERNQGHLWFESEEGVGTTFYVQLERAPEANDANDTENS